MLQVASDALSRVTYACMMEQADDLISGICTAAGVDRTADLPSLNKGRRLRDATSDELAIVAEHNRVDAALYVRVRGRFQRALLAP
ncbi:MAG: hypothetical protein JO359_00170 [Candidatus Eremiobacteraeota bacterium]|nr:hypothetical protein [Candidatus Eremiobacteraeota bacterium]